MSKLILAFLAFAILSVEGKTPPHLPALFLQSKCRPDTIIPKGRVMINNFIYDTVIQKFYCRSDDDERQNPVEPG